MIKVFLAEDEMLIRRGIKNSIDWAKHGYEFVGEASDGELAYPMILKARPDILITDIRMPFVDGLELSKMVKQALPDTHILILSGYNEFEYAKEAIHIGISEYLLKPVNAARLLEVLGAMTKKIEQEREDQQLKERYLSEMQENVEVGKTRFFMELISGRMTMSQVLEMAKSLRLDIGAAAYNMMLFRVSMNINAYESQEQAMQVFAEIESLPNELTGVICFRIGAEGWVFLVSAAAREKVEEGMILLRERLQALMEKYSDIEYFGGIGKAAARLSELGASYDEAGKVFASRFISAPRQILSPGDLKGVDEDHFDNEDLDISSLADLEQKRELLERFLANGTIEEIDSFTEIFTEDLTDDKLRSALMRQYITMDVYITVSSYCERLGENHAAAAENVLQKIISRDDFRRFMKDLLALAIEQRNRIKGTRYSDILGEAKRYIARNYMSEDISLNQVAASVNMSPSYFSTVFSREAGKTFVEYLTEIRMNKAKELLMSSSLKTLEIGFEVGYKDPHYFSYIFKKTQNCTPKDFRQRGMKE